MNILCGLRPVFDVHGLKWSLSSLARPQGCSLSSSTPSLSFQKAWMTSTWMKQSTLCSSLSTFSQQVSLTQAPVLCCLSSGESYQAFSWPYSCSEIRPIFRGEEKKKQHETSHYRRVFIFSLLLWISSDYTLYECHEGFNKMLCFERGSHF